MVVRFGSDFFDYYIYVFVSDGDLMEGISYEVIVFVGYLNLLKLIVFFDDNGIIIDGFLFLLDFID